MQASSPRPIAKGDHVFLVDGSSFVFRAYFQSMNQDRKYNYRSDGLPTGAIRLFCTKLYQFIREGAVGVRPTHLAIIFDKTEQSFRKEIYPQYKANRSDPPDDLIPQFPLMREAVRAFGLEPIEQDRYEADDLIATYARQAIAVEADVLVISADKDLMQLVGPKVAMYDPASGEAGKGRGYRPERRIGVEEVVEYFGVPPDKVVEVQALAGDSTDNIPGAPGIGVKTAAQLITEFGDLDTLLARASEIKQPKRRETLTNPEIVEKVRISRQLVALDAQVAVETPLADTFLTDPDAKSLIAFLKAMEFTTITKRVAEAYGIEADAIEPEARLASKGQAARRAAQAAETPELALDVPAPAPTSELIEPRLSATPSQRAEAAAAEATAFAVDRRRYRIIADETGLKALIAQAFDRGRIAIDLVVTSVDPMAAEIVGLAVATAPNDAAYVPLGHRPGGDLLAAEGSAVPQVPLRAALTALTALLESPGVLKIGHDIKPDLVVLARHGIKVSPIDDVQLMSYVLDAGRGGYGLAELARRHLGHETLSIADVIGKGRTQVPVATLEAARLLPCCAEAPDIAIRLWSLFKTRLMAERMTTVYETLERPLPPVLARMEGCGVSIDRTILARLSSDFAQIMARLEDEIADLAGERFNLGSPKQLGDILFGKMGLPGASKTATGAWSTRADVLEELAEQGHPLPQRILDWRQLSKLRSTYTEALPTYVNAETSRVHTSYALAATTTGRLSSSEPNLQNIPVRTEEGRKIRRAFIAQPGYKLVSADYSQIELRLLAEIAEVPALREAFRSAMDIHALTASEMFGVAVEGMPPDVRRRAKAINFGIIYGISAFGLANQLGIGREEAGAYIRKYFERFPGIRDYMEETKAFCREHGYVTTLFGRKMHYPDIRASNPSMRSFNERASINARLQGSAADIIRRAMVRMEGALAAAELSARMLLQVHDELIFEVPDSEVEATLPVVSLVMAQAPLPSVKLNVPLQVDARAAANWEEAH